MIRLDESDSEYLLYVPFQHKDRAKGIDGRRWDPERRCWAFPKTARVFDAIVGEFGDDLATLTVTRPDTAPKKPTPDPESENVTLREELTELKKLIQLLTSQEGTEVEKMRQALALKSQEIEKAKEELYRVSGKLEHTTQEARTLREENDSLRARLTASKPKSKIDELIQALLTIAGDASGNSHQFLALIKRIKHPERFPLGKKGGQVNYA